MPGVRDAGSASAFLAHGKTIGQILDGVRTLAPNV
jgi:hypothetical protein